MAALVARARGLTQKKIHRPNVPLPKVRHFSSVRHSGRAALTGIPSESSFGTLLVNPRLPQILITGAQQSRPVSSAPNKTTLPTYPELNKYESEIPYIPGGDMYVGSTPLPGNCIINGQVINNIAACINEINEKFISSISLAESKNGNTMFNGDISTQELEEIVVRNYGCNRIAAGSSPADGIQIILNRSGHPIALYLIDPKKYAVSVTSSVIPIDISSGKNGYTLAMNAKVLESIMSKQYEKSIGHLPIIMEKYGVFFQLEDNIPKDEENNTIQNLLNTYLPNFKHYHSGQYKLYSLCIGYKVRSISDISGDEIKLPNNYGEFVSKTQIKEIKKGKNAGTTEISGNLEFKLNQEKLLTDKFCLSKTNIYVFNDIPDDENIKLLSSNLPDYDISYKKLRYPGKTEFLLFITKKGVAEASFPDEFNIDPTTGQLVPTPVVITSPTTAINAATAAGINTPKSPSRPMVGGYKRRRITRRKPRRARV